MCACTEEMENGISVTALILLLLFEVAFQWLPVQFQQNPMKAKGHQSDCIKIICEKDGLFFFFFSSGNRKSDGWFFPTRGTEALLQSLRFTSLPKNEGMLLTATVIRS